MNLFRFSFIATLSLAMVSCEKASIEDLLEKKPSYPTDGEYTHLSIHVGGVEEGFADAGMAKATRGIEPVKDICTKLSVALYDETGARAYSATQKSADNGFGNIDMNVKEGNYTIVVVAHSGDKNATTTDISKIAFGGKLSDTFHYCNALELNGGDSSVDILLNRVTAMFRLEITDDIPSDARQLQFYYTGGSSTLDGTTGIGCVNSRQTEVVDIVSGKTTYDVYTFPHADGKSLTMQVTALDASGNAMSTKTFTDVKVARNTITHYRGNLFSGMVPPASASDRYFSISAETGWLGENVIDF